MAYRNVGLSLRGYTTAQLATLIANYGVSGTIAAGQLKVGTLVRDTTLGQVKVYQLSTDTFVAGTDYV